MMEHGQSQPPAQTPPLPEGVMPRLTVRAIAAVVGEEFDVPLSVMVSPSRSRHVVEPRQIAMWLAHRHTGHTLGMIGRALGGRDHTTVLHGSRVVEARREQDAPFAALLRRLINGVNAVEMGLLNGAASEQPPPTPVEAATPEPHPEPQQKPSPPVVLSGPSRAQRSVLKALAQYLADRDALLACTHTNAEVGARRRVDDSYRDLRRSYAEMSRAPQNEGSAA